jgi:hypothetical protein
MSHFRLLLQPPHRHRHFRYWPEMPKIRHFQKNPHSLLRQTLRFLRSPQKHKQNLLRHPHRLLKCLKLMKQFRCRRYLQQLMFRLRLQQMHRHHPHRHN